MPTQKTEVASPPQVLEAGSKASSSVVDLNQADAATLQRELARVGEAKARGIVAFRQSNSTFFFN